MLLDFISKRYIYLIFSAIIIVPGLISLAIPPGLRPGIEFTSRSLMTLRFADPPDQGPLRGRRERARPSRRDHPADR